MPELLAETGMLAPPERRCMEITDEFAPWELKMWTQYGQPEIDAAYKRVYATSDLLHAIFGRGRLPARDFLRKHEAIMEALHA